MSGEIVASIMLFVAGGVSFAALCAGISMLVDVWIALDKHWRHYKGRGFGSKQ